MADESESRISIAPRYWIIVAAIFGIYSVWFIYTTCTKQ